jgi:hypothetical protein
MTWDGRRYVYNNHKFPSYKKALWYFHYIDGESAPVGFPYEFPFELGSQELDVTPPTATGITAGTQEADGDVPITISDLSENSTAYFSVTTSDQSAASAAAVKTAGGGGAGLTNQVDFGTFSANVGGGPYTPPLTTGLSGNHYIQIVFEDASANLSTVYSDGPVAINTVTEATFFTQGATGPYFVDPSNLPANTTAVRFIAKFRIPTGTSFPVLAALWNIESDSFDVELWANNNITFEKLEDSTGTSLVGTNIALTTWANDTWYTLDMKADHTADEYTWSLNGSGPTTVAYSTASNGVFTSAREISFLATSTGTQLMHEGVEIEYLEVYLTTTGFDGGNGAGVEYLHKRIAGNAATVNADGWKAGGDAT